MLRQRILFALAIAAAVAVELLAKGPWAHAVWAPVAIMFFTDLEGVFDTKKAIAAIPQRVRILLGAGGALGVELLADGKWAHAVWAPVVLMLYSDMRKVLWLPEAPAPARAAPEPQAESSEAVTPLDKPR